MYLRGLAAGEWDTRTSSEIGFANRMNDAVTLNTQQYNSCLHANGYWDGSTCHLPQTAAPAQSPANITVTVPTNTQVSPQISPNLIQQQQPTNSPVGASTSSTPTSGDNSQVVEMLRQQQAQAAAQAAALQAAQDAADQRNAELLARTAAESDARQAALIEALKKQQAASATQTVQYVPEPASDAPTPQAPAPVEKKDNSMLYIAMAGLLIGVVGLQQKGK